MSKRKSNATAKKTNEKKDSVFISLLCATVVASVVWFLLTAIFSAILLKNENSTLLANVFSYCIPALSMFAVGVVLAKKETDNAIFLSCVLAFFFLALAWVISKMSNLASDSVAFSKILNIVIFLLPPVFGTRLGTRKKKRSHARKHGKA